ncbi:MAG: hypothetical protein JXM79_12790 [Sedimentisphaerales bacterium]|nr:hypothetical protein [Sedimentisphaerales bacterium]
MFKDESEFEKVVDRLNIDTTPNPAHREALHREMVAAFKEEKPAPRTLVFRTLRRTIMKSPITKCAAAAVIIAGVLAGLHFIGNPFQATVTFADVIKPIFSARTAILDIIVGEDEQGPVIHDMIMGSRIRRTLSNMDGVIAIIDMDAGRILQLAPEKKEAAYISLKDWPSMPNYLDGLRNIITKLQESPEFEVEELGVQQVKGLELIGFRATHPKTKITLWADPKTALPVRIEQVTGQMHVICRDLQFDVPLDEELFDMNVPEGYTMQQAELDLMGATEEDFIEGLRILAQVLGDGTFPDSIAVEDFLKWAPEAAKRAEELGLSEEEKIEMGLKMQQHLMFIRFFKGEGQWHYAGKGVKFGNADAAIFWYRPEGSETYRVVYGDLSVKNVAPENLP